MFTQIMKLGLIGAAVYGALLALMFMATPVATLPVSAPNAPSTPSIHDLQFETDGVFVDVNHVVRAPGELDVQAHALFTDPNFISGARLPIPPGAKPGFLVTIRRYDGKPLDAKSYTVMLRFVRDGAHYEVWDAIVPDATGIQSMGGVTFHVAGTLYSVRAFAVGDREPWEVDPVTGEPISAHDNRCHDGCEAVEHDVAGVRDLGSSELRWITPSAMNVYDLGTKVKPSTWSCDDPLYKESVAKGGWRNTYCTYDGVLFQNGVAIVQ